MATYKVLSSSAPYYTILVQFDDQEFTQTIVSAKTGAALNKQIEEYVVDYEQQFTANAGE